MDQRLINILLVEDNPDHVFLIKDALDESKSNRKIYVVNNGIDALDFLHNRNEYQDKNLYPCPDLILLDIKLPKISGLEVLNEVKSDQHLKHIPVVIISSSSRQSDVQTAYTSGVNSYISKPVKHSEFATKIEQLEMYWLNTNILPTVEEDLEF